MSEILDPRVSNETVALKKAPEVLSTSEEGQELIRAIYDAPELGIEHTSETLTGLEALDSKFFIGTDNLARQNADMIINADTHTNPIEIPMDLVVSAQSFASWRGRRDGVTKTISTDEGYKTLTSMEVIKLYASKQRGTRPTIPEFDMFIQPDGKIYFANSNDGSHRLAAAIYNGEKSISTLSLRVKYLEDSIL